MSFGFQFGNDLLYLLSNRSALKLPLTKPPMKSLSPAVQMLICECVP
jgi:hypothetical protein